MSSPPPCLLVVCGSSENWYELCQGLTVRVPGRTDAVPLVVEQSMWDEMSLTSYPDEGAVVQLQRSPRPVDPRQEQRRVCRPDLVLVRNFCRSVGGRLQRNGDLRNLLLGLWHAGVPLVNSFRALYAELERPVVYGALAQVVREYGRERFPLIPQNYYPDHSDVVIVPEYPIVLKVGFPHAGFGKARVNNSEELEDISGIVALHNDYVTAERFVENVAHELRIVRIAGPRGAPAYYRAHKRMGMGWKVNTGAQEREDVEMCDRWKFWVDRASECLGGLEILALDAIVDAQGRETILEVNGSEMGLAPEHERNALEAIRSLCVSRLEEEMELRSSGNGNAPKAMHTEAEQSLEIEVVNLRNRCAEQAESLECQQNEIERLRMLRTKLKGPSSLTISAFVATVSVVLVLLVQSLLKGNSG